MGHLWGFGAVQLFACPEIALKCRFGQFGILPPLVKASKMHEGDRQSIVMRLKFLRQVRRFLVRFFRFIEALRLGSLPAGEHGRVDSF